MLVYKYVLMFRVLTCICPYTQDSGGGGWSDGTRGGGGDLEDSQRRVGRSQASAVAHCKVMGGSL